MTDILTLMKERHSSRIFFDPNHFVAKEDLNKILEPGSWPPTAQNMQNFEVIIIDDKKLIEETAAIKSAVSLPFVKENHKQFFFRRRIEEKKDRYAGDDVPPGMEKARFKEGS